MTPSDPTEELVERVSRAIARENCPYPGVKADQTLDSWVEEFWQDWRDTARAAISAMQPDMPQADK
jgi:hypothetical protein